MHGAAGGGGQQGASLAYRTPRGTTICIEELPVRLVARWASAAARA
eukprot:COSAG02_NODE_46783_length_346_cov_0.692308_1_plen_45_part_10